MPAGLSVGRASPVRGFSSGSGCSPEATPARGPPCSLPPRLLRFSALFHATGRAPLVPAAFHQGRSLIITRAWEHVVPTRTTTSRGDRSPPCVGRATATEPRMSQSRRHPNPPDRTGHRSPVPEPDARPPARVRRQHHCTELMGRTTGLQPAALPAPGAQPERIRQRPVPLGSPSAGTPPPARSPARLPARRPRLKAGNLSAPILTLPHFRASWGRESHLPDTGSEAGAARSQAGST
jgi:hypothetical protein